MSHALPARQLPMPIETPRRTLKPPSSGIVLWAPRVVLAPGIRATRRSLVALGEPAARPEAVRSQIDVTRSVLGSLASASAMLAQESAQADTTPATSEAERVSATMESYRVQARLDDVLIGAFRQLTTLMEERGLR